MGPREGLTFWFKGICINTQQQNQVPRLSPTTGDEPLGKRLVEDSPDCLKVLDLDGRLLSMNAGGMKVLEICDLTPFIGSSWIDFWQGADREAAQVAVKTARDGGIGRFV